MRGVLTDTYRSLRCMHGLALGGGGVGGREDGRARPWIDRARERGMGM